MAIELPEVIARYIETVNSNEADALVAGFSGTAIVHDEGRTHEGTAAISKWMAEAKAKYNYTIEPLDAVTRDDRTHVTARLTGSFPGSPIQLEFIFELERNTIRSLEIH